MKLLKVHVWVQLHTSEGDKIGKQRPQRPPCPPPHTDGLARTLPPLLDTWEGQGASSRAAHTRERSHLRALPVLPPLPRSPAATLVSRVAPRRPAGEAQEWASGYLARPRWPRSRTVRSCWLGAISGRAAKASPHPLGQTFGSRTGRQCTPLAGAGATAGVPPCQGGLSSTDKGRGGVHVPLSRLAWRTCNLPNSPRMEWSS